MKKSTFLSFVVAIVLFSSCGNKEKIAKLESELAFKTKQVAELENQVDYLKNTNSSQLELMTDLSVINKSGAESIKKSLESISQQYGFIQDLTTKIQNKDSLNLALVMNLKRSLSDINDDDIQVEVRGGKVHVSISDKLLFSSGSSKINAQAKGVIDKIATVINDHYELDVLVEGHTDDIPITNSCVADNWDLSVKRATAVVRMLQEDYLVEPERLTAAGRSQFDPRAENETDEGRSMNRRTEIVIMPKLDQFFKLLESPDLMN
ncbi:MAG: OmpA family protein [Bacteroidota bacterium]